MKLSNTFIATLVLAVCGLFSTTTALAASTPPPATRPAPSQSPSSSPPPASASPSPSASTSPDSDFVQSAIQTELGLYALASVGQKKATDRRLKQLAKKLQTSTVTASRFLESYAKQHSILIPKTAQLRAMAQYSDISSLSGKDFDRQFGKSINIDANIDLDTFTEQVQHGKDPVLHEFAKKTVSELTQLAKATDQYKGA